METSSDNSTATDMSDIKSWSYSRLLDYEACPLRAKLKYVDRIPVESGVAADRGTAIHLQAEQFVKGEITTLPSTLALLSENFHKLRDLYAAGQVSLEGEWGFDDEWMPTDYRTARLRVKADAVVHVSDTHAVVIDYKTGRKDGNEVKHGEQVQLYAIAVLIRHPELQAVTVELWYTDKDDITICHYTRMQALRYVQSFQSRASRMLEAKSFPANPTIHTCKWCSFSPAKGGQCAYGVVPGQSPLKLYRAKFG